MNEEKFTQHKYSYKLGELEKLLGLQGLIISTWKNMSGEVTLTTMEKT